MPISQPIFQTQTHSYHSLGNEGTCLVCLLYVECYFQVGIKVTRGLTTFLKSDNKDIFVSYVYLFTRRKKRNAYLL